MRKKRSEKGMDERDDKTLALLEREGLSLEQLRRNYVDSVDAGSKTYEQRGSPYRLEVERKWLFKKVTPAEGELVLDGGCGTGHYLPDLLENDIAVVGCDLSTGCIKVCRDRCAKATRGQLHLFRATVRNLPFRSQVFDRIISRHVLQHIPLASERLGVLREFQRALKTGGWLHIITYNNNIRHRLSGTKEGIAKKRYYYYRYSVREVTADIKRVFGRRPTVRGLCNTLPYLPRLGSLGVRIDQQVSLLPWLSCLNSYVLFASVMK